MEKDTAKQKNIILGLHSLKIKAVRGIDGKNGEKGEQGIQGKTGMRGPKGKDGESVMGLKGKDGRDGRDGKDGKDGSFDTPDETIDKINKAEKKINPEQIKGLASALKDIDSMGKFPRGVAASGIGDLGLKFFVNDLSSQLDGSTKTFTIPPNRMILDVKCSSFPHVFRETTDYVVSGISRETFTFTSEISATTTLASGQTLIITGIRP